MTLEELARLGKQMRDSQERFFRSKNPLALKESQSYERHFDRVVHDVLHPPAPTFQDYIDRQRQE